MGQYISKSALVAEIERLIDEPAPSHNQQCQWEDGYYSGLYKAESIIDNLEIKEVDLEKEVNDVMKRFLGNITCREEQLKFAKHFFELGLKAQKGE